MIRLNEYIDIQKNPNEYICEGGIWQKIKDWFKSLFSDDSDKVTPWGKDDNQLIGNKLTTFTDYINDHYNKQQLKFVILEKPSEIKKCLSPNGIQPDESAKSGFYKFLSVLDEKSALSKYSFVALLYRDSISKVDYIDTAGMFAFNLYKDNSHKMILRQFQLDSKYFSKLNHNEFINKFLKFLKQSDKFVALNYVKFLETFDQENFNILINDCNFSERFDREDDCNIAFKNIKK